MSWLRLVRTFRAHPRPTASWRRHAISTSVGDTGFREVRSQQGSGSTRGVWRSLRLHFGHAEGMKRVPRTSFIILLLEEWESGSK